MIRIPTRRLPLALAAASLALAACATVQEATRVQDRSTALLSDKPAPREGCQISQRPQRLPSLSEIADSAALVQGVKQLHRAQPLAEGEGRILFSLGWGPSGQVERVKDIDWFLPQGAAAQYTSLVQRTLRPQAVKTDLRLRIVPGGEPSFQVGRAEICPPRALVRFQVNRSAFASTPDAPTPIRARVMIGTAGEALGVTITRSSGNTEIDQWVIRKLQELTHLPGLIDGVPQRMDAEVDVPIRQS